ncbi:MAG: RNB domain-containing ribonuclease [Ottowia sp.]|nr:RNB domain-containing ribonuclease [Ottowia sp.]
MNLLFEEGSEIKAATLLAQQGESWQAQCIHGRRIKIKERQVLMQFGSPDPADLMEQAIALARTIELPFLWECASQAEFYFVDLANEYFGVNAQSTEKAALLFALQGAPVYFRRKGQGRFTRAPIDQLQAALAALDRKKAQAQLQSEYETLLKAKHLPAVFRDKAISLLFKPDKNSVEFKALEASARALGITPVKLLVAAGGIASPLALHEARFMAEHFPRGRDFPALAVPSVPVDLPLADVGAFSIDDSSTTEIDDAFSVHATQPGQWRIGIHIAAPALGIARGDALDILARERLSTVYFPGDKITMLPDEVIGLFTLSAGQVCPALSLYLTVDEASWEVIATQTCIERITVAHNLRHNLLDDIVTQANLNTDSGDYPCKSEIAVLWRWANHLHEVRQKARAANGLRPESHTRPDYTYTLETLADGDTKVHIVPRLRGAPLDKIVAELMILANSSWGKMLADVGVPGIYRAQRGWGAVRTRMQTTPAPHEGLGVAQYAWSTSPLRRYVDLVNQWQIMAVARHGITAKMVAPFAPGDVSLMAIAADFDTTYASYLQHQNTMEQYWCLRWLQQEERTRVSAVVLKESAVRLTDVPLMVTLPELVQQPLARGTDVLLDISGIDEVELTVQARLLEIFNKTGSENMEDPESVVPHMHTVPSEAAP